MFKKYLKTHPSVILVRPQLGENIGAAARVMANFGLAELRLVAPRDGWPNPAADAMASHARHIIEHATIYNSTAEAVADIELLYATTARPRDMEKPVITPREAAAQMRQSKKPGLLFGPERTGLVNEDIARSAAIINIPVDPDYASLNLAQAIAITAYEWFCAGAAPFAPTQENPPATQSELDGLLGHIEHLAGAANFYQAAHKKERMDQNIRNIFARASLTGQEVRTLRGLFRAIGGLKVEEHSDD